MASTRMKMMWTHALLLLLAGAAFANRPGYENGKEYTYKFRSRTVATVDASSNQFAGVLIEAHLSIQPNGQEAYRAKLTRARYAQVHTILNDWESEIPPNQKSMLDFPIGSQPFEIKTKNGVVKDLVVDRSVPTWEVNFLKSIVSQFQVNTLGENAIPSTHNIIPEGDKPYASFNTMEDSVGGDCEVRYDISPVTEEELQNHPELAPMPQLREDGEIISAWKSKNYTNCEIRASYNFGVDGRNNWKPSTNANGNHLSRSTVSRIVVSGNLKSNIIQSSVTVNKVIHGSHSRNPRDQGMVATKVNVTLHDVTDVTDQIQAPSNPESTGNLVYSYNSPFERESRRRPNMMNHGKGNRRNNGGSNSNESDENNSRSASSGSSEENSDDSYLQPLPTMTDPPQIPMSPLFIGNNGKSIRLSDKINLERTVKNFAQRIANDMEDADQMFEGQTLERFAQLSMLIRLMKAEEIAEVRKELYEPEPSSNQLSQNNEGKVSRRRAWVAFRDAVALSGTGPALINIKLWIKNKMIKGYEAVNIVDNIARTARVPTLEFMDTFFELVQTAYTNDESGISDGAILSFADFIRHVAVDKHSSHNRYPVHAFGKFSKKADQRLVEKYLPFMADQLKSAIESGDNAKAQLFITALGKTGHPRILKYYEPYFTGMIPVTEFQALTITLSLSKLAETNPRIAQAILSKMYISFGTQPDVRTAAVFLLMKTNPTAPMLQRMAAITNTDVHKQVNSAVKSIIESLSELEESDNPELVNAAKSARPFLTKERFGLEYSKMFFTNFIDPISKSGFNMEVNWIGSDDSNIPKGFYIGSTRQYKGDKTPDFEWGASVNCIRDFYSLIEKKLYANNQNNNNQNEQSNKFSPENIAKMLNIQGENAEPLEGYAFLNNNYANRYMSFQNRTIEKTMSDWINALSIVKNTKNFQNIKLNNDEIAIRYPMESGFPFSYTTRAPILSSAEGQIRAEGESEHDRPGFIPKKIQVEIDARLLYSLKIQNRLSFVTPFEHQQYIAGLDRSMQIHVPLHAEIDVLYGLVTRIKLQPKEGAGNFKVIQYKTEPFTSKQDVFDLEPVTKNKNTHIIRKERATQSNIELNDRNNKPVLRFSWEKVPSSLSNNENNQNSNQNKAVREMYELGQSLASMLTPAKVNSEYQQYSVKLSPSSDTSVEVQMSADSKESTEQNNDNSNDNEPTNFNSLKLSANLNKNERKQKMLEEAARNINSAKAHVVDLQIDVSGGLQSSMSVTVAHATSNVDPKSRVLLHSAVNSMNNQQYCMCAGVEKKNNPRAQPMDFEEVLKANNRVEVIAGIGYGKLDQQDVTKSNMKKVEIRAKLEQTENRKNEVRQSPNAEKCNKQKSQSGNKMTSECQKARDNAKSMDRGDVTITFNNESLLKNLALNAVDMMQRRRNPLESFKNRQDKEEKDKIKVNLELSPNNDKVDVTVKSEEGKVNFKNVDMNPINSFISRDNRNKENLNSISHQTNVCNLDKTQINTFDNRRISAPLGDCWHVAMTSFPKNDPDSPSQKQPIPQHMRVTVLTKENSNGQKELKVNIGNVQIDLKPSESPSESERAQVKVNGKRVELSKHKSHQEQENDGVAVELFKLKDGSVKLVSNMYDVKIVYDGSRAQIEAGNKYRNSVRGICGTHNGEPENDQKTPRGCTLKKPEEFIATWAMTNEENCEGPARENAEKAKQSRCVNPPVRSINVISDREAGRQDSSSKRRDNDNNDKQCTRHRTRVMKSENEICFSKRPVPACSSKCKPDGMKNKPIAFHCVARNSASEKIAQRVEKGANPDLSEKSTTKSETQQVPTSCRPA